ncbi:hypothetical protein EPH_0061030 [Eimeria praecox]|uniref:Uncharacterized protein n=1 Tax=Eimeria praecox TaxID=51316 RepID=U6GZP1_9EIME|nr:hypothetical protein EPH_0061030 [Eimeria praecox]
MQKWEAGYAAVVDEPAQPISPPLAGAQSPVAEEPMKPLIPSPPEPHEVEERNSPQVQEKGPLSAPEKPRPVVVYTMLILFVLGFAMYSFGWEVEDSDVEDEDDEIEFRSASIDVVDSPGAAHEKRTLLGGDRQSSKRGRISSFCCGFAAFVFREGAFLMIRLIWVEAGEGLSAGVSPT